MLCPVNNLRFWAKILEKVKWRFAIQPSRVTTWKHKKKSSGAFCLNFCVWEKPPNSHALIANLVLVVPSCAQVERLLTQATTSLFFNMFELNEATSGHPLSTLAFFLIMQIGSIDGWGMDVIKLARYCLLPGGGLQLRGGGVLMLAALMAGTWMSSSWHGIAYCREGVATARRGGATAGRGVLPPFFCPPAAPPTFPPLLPPPPQTALPSPSPHTRTHIHIHPLILNYP